MRRICNYFAFVALFILSAGYVRAHEGWGIVVDRRGQVYFSDIPTNTIWKITREGSLKVVATDEHSHALVMDEGGNIYGTHENGRVWRITPDGSYMEVLPPTRDFPLSLHSFIIDRQGNIYSMNAGSVQSEQVTLLKRTADGQVTTLAGGSRGHADGHGLAAKFEGIDGMAWASDDSLHLTDGAYVRRVQMNGEVTTLTEPLTEPLWGEDLMGLVVSPGGEVYVADYSNRRVRRVAQDGSVSTVLQTGWYWSPTGVTLDGEELYVLEHIRMPLFLLGNVGIGPYARVRKVSPDGTVATLGTVWGRNTLIFIVTLLALVSLFVLAWRFYKRRELRRIHSASAE